MRQIFLDYQSGTPLLPEALEKMKPFFSQSFGNPSSIHRFGLEAREAIAEARLKVARMINSATPEQIIFTGNGAEAVNLAIKGTAYANRRRGNHIVFSAIEHPAVTSSIEFLVGEGFSATKIPVDRYGFLDPDAVRAALTDQTILLCFHHANHDIGTLQPIRDISAVTRDKGIPLFVDAVASAGWHPIDVEVLGADLLAFSPHRFYGPKGVGVLYRGRGARINPIIHGGDQENGRRAGTEDVPAIIGAGVAAERAMAEISARQTHTAGLQRLLWSELEKSIPNISLSGPPLGERRIETNLNVSFRGLEGEGLMLTLDLQGIAVASGAACTLKSLRLPQTLAEIGLDEELALGNLILTLGKDNTAEEMTEAAAVISKTVAKLRSLSPAWPG